MNAGARALDKIFLVSTNALAFQNVTTYLTDLARLTLKDACLWIHFHQIREPSLGLFPE